MKADTDLSTLGLDKLIHERARLMILSYLASSESPETGFTELRDGLGFSAGNLSIQLKTLEEAGYIGIEKRFKDNKPYTGVRMTVKGEGALDAYLADLEIIVASLKSGQRGGSSPVAAPIQESEKGPSGTKGA